MIHLPCRAAVSKRGNDHRYNSMCKHLVSASMLPQSQNKLALQKKEQHILIQRFRWGISELSLTWLFQIGKDGLCCVLFPHGKTAVYQHLVHTQSNRCTCLFKNGKMASEVIVTHSTSAGTFFKISVKSIYCPENIKMRHTAEKG